MTLVSVGPSVCPMLFLNNTERLFLYYDDDKIDNGSFIKKFHFAFPASSRLP